MQKWLAALVAFLSLTAAPALAAPCKTQGTVEAPIAFPKNDASDIELARSMNSVMFPDVSSTVPSALTCNRAAVTTALGTYLIGGENGETFPRMARRADGGPGPVIYLAASSGAPGIYALVVHPQGPLTIVKRFYAGIPTNQRLQVDVIAALADNAGIMALDAERQTVMYAFLKPGYPSPPAQSVHRPDGTSVVSGPQILILDSGDPKLLDVGAEGMRHKPSGFACPQTFKDLPVLLKTMDPRTNALACAYRAGTDLHYQQDAPTKYEITLVKPQPGETPRILFDTLVASAPKSYRIKGDHVPPLAIGPGPEPEFVAYWDTENAGVQGVWVGKAGGWLVWVRAQYPPSPANDAEAGKVAQALFAQLGQQVK